MVNFQQLLALESDVQAKLKSLASMVNPMLTLAAELEMPIELLFPASAPAFKMLDAFVAGVKAIETAAPNLSGNIAALKAAAAPLEADVQAIRAAVEQALHPMTSTASNS